MRIFRKQYSFIHSLFRRNLTLRSGTLLSVFLISMISLLSALTRPLSQDQQNGGHDVAPIRGQVLSIPSGQGLANGGNFTRFEPNNGERKIQARAAEVVYITRKSSEQIYFADNSRRAISIQKASEDKRTDEKAPLNSKTKVSAESDDHKYNDNKLNETNSKIKSKQVKSSTKNVVSKPSTNSKSKVALVKNSKAVSYSTKDLPKVEKENLMLPKHKEATSNKKSSKPLPEKTGDNRPPHLAKRSIPRTIQFYAQPPWLNNRDVGIMRLLSEGVVQRRIGLSQNRSTEYLLYLENVTEDGTHLENNSVPVRIRTCVDAISLSCKEWPRVLAFHLDRIVGLNRVVPAAGRYFTELYSTTIHEGSTETAVWFPADLPAKQYGDDSLEATRYVKKKFWRFSDRQKWSLVDECAKNVEGEKVRMAVFLFLLQIKEKQLQECFKYPANHSHAPKHQDPASHLSCRNTFWGSGMRLTGQTWCLPPLGVNIIDTENFNYTVLESIQSFPSDILEIIRSNKLRQHLLQSLFVDRIFWESQGARKGIENIIHVIDKRSKALLKWFTTKGVVPR
ncbi:Golgi-associated kinase 1B-like isoform X2 [Apostichopus japonicus]